MKKLILGLFLLGAAGGGGYFAYDHFKEPVTGLEERAHEATSEQPETEPETKPETTNEAPQAEETR